MRSYLITGGACLTAITLHPYVPGFREGYAPFLLSFLPPMVGAWLGGLRSGLPATFFMTVWCNIFFIPPYGSVSTHPTAVTVTLVLLVQSIICVAFISHARNIIKRQKVKSQQKDVFVATLAHEFRNPLAIIGNCLEILSAHTDPIVIDTLRVISRHYRHLTHLVNDLLDIARIEQGKVALARDCIFVRAVIDQAIEAVRSDLEQKGHTLKVECPPEPIRVEGDHTRLCQILTNLLCNSIKYTDRHDGVIQVVVSVEATFVSISVIDNGIGIAPKQMPHIFEPFFQAVETTEQGSGMGLGLPLAKKLTEMHGGTLTVKSEGLGQGTTVVCRLPRYLGPAPDTDNSEPATEKKKLKILVVDDVLDALHTMRIILQNAGHEVFVATSGSEAIEATRTHNPDVILLDITLPDISGYEVCKLIREKHNGRRNIIAVTGHGRKEDRERSKRAGFDHHLTKPISMQDLDEAMMPPRKNEGSHPCPN